MPKYHQFIYWTGAQAKVWLYPSVLKARSRSWLISFSDFFMSKKSDEARFLKNRPYGSGVSKKSRKWPKNEVLVVLGKLKSIHIYFFFCLNLKVLNGLLAFCKNCMSGLHMTALRYEVEFLYLIRYT